MTRGSLWRPCLHDLEAADISGETERADWSTPREALAAERSGVIRMLPPTMSILIELADLPTVAERDQSCARTARSSRCCREWWKCREWLAVSLSAGPSSPELVMTSSRVGAAYVQLIRAPNPGPMTLDGTNTWVISDADEGALVVDPGPAIQSHLEAVLAACEPRLRHDRADPPAS